MAPRVAGQEAPRRGQLSCLWVRVRAAGPVPHPILLHKGELIGNISGKGNWLLEKMGRG